MEGARTAVVLPAAQHEAEHEGNAARLAARPGVESSVLRHAAAGGLGLSENKTQFVFVLGLGRGMRTLACTEAGGSPWFLKSKRRRQQGDESEPNTTPDVAGGCGVAPVVV